MREDQLSRLSSTDINLNNSLYLHYKSYHKALFRAFNIYAKGQLLDIGCGNKPYHEVLAAQIESYTGCDIAQSDQTAVDIICPANNIPLEDGIFDTVISTQTIEHVEDHQGLINEAYRLLKNGGYCIISGPMYWPLHEEPYDFFRITKHGFRYLLERSGFTVLEINANGGKWAVAGQALIHAVYPTLLNIKGFKGKVIKTLFRVSGGVKTINKLFDYIDNKAIDTTNTMNYVVIAKKAEASNENQPA
ncbi:hypothetical protein GCM10027037_24030 [Mucilaginibacter koreensis]